MIKWPWTRKPTPQPVPAPEPRPVRFEWSTPPWFDEAKEMERLEDDEWARIDKTSP